MKQIFNTFKSLRRIATRSRPKKPQVGLVAAFKNEGPWVLEWVAHHKALGFHPIGVATNDCSDHTDAMLARLAELGAVVHIDQTGDVQESAQITGYKKLKEHPAFQECDWLMALDGDELLNIRKKSIQDYVAQFPDADIVTLSWRIFGDSGFQGFPDGPMSEVFKRAAPPGDPGVGGFKSLVRDPHRFSALYYHLPGPFKDRSRSRTVSAVFDGQPIQFEMPSTETNFRHLLYQKRDELGVCCSYEMGQINHYMTKTRQIFEFKRTRGSGAKTDAVRYTDHFFRHNNRNDDLDDTIKKHSAGANVEMRSFRRDRVLRQLHQDSRRLWAEKIKLGDLGF